MSLMQPLFAHNAAKPVQAVHVEGADGAPATFYWHDGTAFNGAMGWRNEKLVYFWAPPGQYKITLTHRDGTVEAVETQIAPLADQVKQVKYRDGKPFWVRTISRSDEYTIEESSYRHLTVPEGSTVLDLGGHIGTFTRDALNRGAAKVVTVEAEPSNYILLTWNSSGFPVEPIFGAIGNRAEMGDHVTLYANWKACSTIHSLEPTRGRIPLPIPVVDLQQVLAQHQPSVIKCDIEGGEYGLDLTMPDCVRHVAMEVHTRKPEWREHAAPALLQKMESQGFQLAKPIKLDKGARLPIAVWER